MQKKLMHFKSYIIKLRYIINLSNCHKEVRFALNFLSRWKVCLKQIIRNRSKISL